MKKLSRALGQNLLPKEYLPFLDLVKRGVPKQAVKNKLMSMNLDPSIIDKPYSGPIINTNKNKLMDDINKMNFKLNKTSDIKTIHKSKSIYEAPSLRFCRFCIYIYIYIYMY